MHGWNAPAARKLETKILTDTMQVWLDNLIADLRTGHTKSHERQQRDPSTWPRAREYAE